MPNDLKPCPCCGSSDLSDEDTYVMCLQCGLMLDISDADNRDFKAAWNRRALPAGCVVVPREVLERCIQHWDWDGAPEKDAYEYGQECDRLSEELRAILARQGQKEDKC